MQFVFSSLFEPTTKLMWIPTCDESNLQSDTQWKRKVTRETTMLVNGFKPKVINSSSCRPAVCFNEWLWIGPSCGFTGFFIIRRSRWNGCESWWRHEMETFSALLVLCAGIHRSPVNSPHKDQWRRALMFSLICALNKHLSKQSRGWWFETPSRLLCRHCNVTGNAIGVC